MNTPNATLGINMAKVRAAVTRYCAPSVHQSHEPVRKDPVDSAIRKPLRNRADKCSGFYCRDFLHGH